MNAILSIGTADAIERMRRFTFLLTIAAALYAAYLYVPSAHAAYATVVVHGHRGLYTAPFIGAVLAALTGPFLALFGFFLVRGSVERDREFGVEGIVCASPVRRITFLLGKFASNLAVFVAIAGIVMVAGMLMQQVRGEDRAFDLASFVLPMLFLTVPGMALVAALAIVFDVIPLLRGMIGSIVYVMAVWSQLLIVPFRTSASYSKLATVDPLGISVITSNLVAAVKTAFPGEKRTGLAMGGSPMPHGGMSTYVFHGFHWTPAILLERFAWFGVAIAIVLAISIFFDRFQRDATGSNRTAFVLNVSRWIPNIPSLALLRAEFALLVNGASWPWLIGAVGLAIASGIAPLGVATHFILPVALIWPLERLSALGARGKRWGVEEILSATRGYDGRTIFVQWFAGALLGALICAGYLVHLISVGNVTGALACLAVVGATSACALALGVTSGNSRLFEALYLVVWYVGPVNAVAPLDFAGGTISAPIVLSIVAGGVLLAALAVAARTRALAAR